MWSIENFLKSAEKVAIDVSLSKKQSFEKPKLKLNHYTQ